MRWFTEIRREWKDLCANTALNWQKLKPTGHLWLEKATIATKKSEYLLRFGFNKMIAIAQALIRKKEKQLAGVMLNSGMPMDKKLAVRAIIAKCFDMEYNNHSK